METETMFRQDASNENRTTMEEQGDVVSDDLQAKIDAVYTPLEEAKEEIWRRWHDKALKKKVEEFLGGDIPEYLKSKPRAILSRHVVSPNFEMIRFLELSKAIELRPLCFEYLWDKFVTKNKDKYFLGKLFVYEGIGKHGGEKILPLKIVDFDRNDGEVFSKIKTLWGGGFVDFHHAILGDLVSDEDIFDMSDSYRRNGGVASNYYKYLIALFICHGVLFENYLLCDNYKKITEEVFLPNFHELQRIFDVKPIIVRLVPAKEECSMRWRYYPEIVKSRLDVIMKKVSI